MNETIVDAFVMTEFDQNKNLMLIYYYYVIENKAKKETKMTNGLQFSIYALKIAFRKTNILN